DNLNEEGFPIVDEEIDLKFMAGQAPATNPDWNDVMIFNEFEDMTNINIEWEMVTHETLEEKRNLAFGGGQLPDAFHSTSMGSPDLMKYGEQGLLDRKSTRLNSSHVSISYAVFCLKKKKN